MNIHKLWAYTDGTDFAKGKGTKVGVIDGSYETTHEMFSGKTITQHGSNNIVDATSFSHGTWVAAMAAGNGSVAPSVAAEADLHLATYTQYAHDSSYQFKFDSIKDIFNSMKTADAKVVNNSWGFRTNISGCNFCDYEVDEFQTLMTNNPGKTKSQLAGYIWDNDKVTSNDFNIDDDGNGYIDDFIGWDCSGFSGGEDNNPMPPSGVNNGGTWAHGTHVAGLLSAHTDNNTGIASAAFNCSIMCVKVSTGEQEPNPYRFRDLMDIANPDILQPDILNIGGITGLVKVYEMAVARNKIIMPHCPQAGLNLIGSLHAYSTVTNAVRPHEFSEEFTGPVENVAKLFKEPIVPENGKIVLSDRPGLGLEYDENELNKVIKI